MQLGEAFVGEGPDAAHVNTVLGARDGPAGAAWAAALATPSEGFSRFVVVAQPNVPVQPFTLFVNKARIESDRHARLTWGPAQAGVAGGVVDALAGGFVTMAIELVVIAAVWVDPAADDVDEVYRNNRTATRLALERSVDKLPAEQDVLNVRYDVWNPFYRMPPV
jgi:5,6,7,8-tetrahydromethanopterin hydro-lyase